MKNKKGFTLIELMVVMAIIAILSVLIVAAIQAARRSSVESQNRGNAKTIETALEAVSARNGGVYCGVQSITCGNTSLTAVGTQLVAAGFLSQNVEGSCAGITQINLQASTFTISVPKYDCTTAAPIQTITH